MSLVLISVATLTSSMASAESAWLSGATIDATMVHTTKFGQCLAKTTPDPKVSLPGCKAGWVTFDCGAEFAGSTRMNSAEKFELAKIANSLNQKVIINFTDDKTINGYCFAEQIRVLR